MTPTVSSHAQHTPNNNSRAKGKRHFTRDASMMMTNGNHAGIKTVSTTAPRISPEILMRRRNMSQA
jgi:hypothetical protein